MNDSQTLSPGTTLYNGSYRVRSILGRGGFGITYLAEDVNLDKLVAIKEFFPTGMYERDDASGYASLGSSDNSELSVKLKDKFLKEARRIASLDHESIVRVTAAFEERGTAYYVMDFIEGQDLQSMVKIGGPLSADCAMRYIRQIGGALAYLHNLRINHLDVKPANILIDKNKDRAMLIDFGLSKQYDSSNHQTSTTPVGVSHGYAPNEQYRPGGVTSFSAPTDVYALGATLYFLLTGQKPPTASELGEEPLRFPSNIPVYLQTAISRAMSFARVDRYQTITDFLADIDCDTTSNASSNVLEIEPEIANVKKRNLIGKIALWGFIIIVVAYIVCIVSNDDDSEAEYKRPRVKVPMVSVPDIEPPVYSNEESNIPILVEDETSLDQEPEDIISPDNSMEEDVNLLDVVSSTPHSLDLRVTWGGDVYYISESDWQRLSLTDKNKVKKEGLYLTGNGLHFLLDLHDLQEAEIDWDEAMEKYEKQLPTKSQADVIGRNNDAINRALSVFGAKSMNSHEWNRYWTNTEQNTSYAWAVNMDGGSLFSFYKTTAYRVRAVTNMP